MTGIIGRLSALAGTEADRAMDLAHRTFQDRMGTHRHFGRALVETVGEICRNHPNLVGIGVGIVVDRLLVEEKHRHDAHLAEAAAHPPQVHADKAPRTSGGRPPPPARPQHAPTRRLRMSRIHPVRIAFEVFGALVLLKLGAAGARMFGRKKTHDGWFAHAAKIRLFSGSIAAYNLASAIRSPKVSAWRNGAIFFFGTDALKPVLKPGSRWRVITDEGPLPAPMPTPAPVLTPPAGTGAAPAAQPPDPQPPTPEAVEPVHRAPEAAGHEHSGPDTSLPETAPQNAPTAAGGAPSVH